MKVVQISVTHIILLAMTFIGLKNHVTIIPALLQSTGRDGWMTVLLSAVCVFPWFFLLLYIQNGSQQQPLASWLKAGIGPFFSAILIWSTIVYCMLLAAFTIRETLLWVSVTFLPTTPMLYLLAVYTLLVGVLIMTNLQTITIVNVIVLYGVVVLGFFVAFINIKVKNYELLRPFFEHGWEPIVQHTVYPLSGFVELLLLLFLQHYTKGRLRLRHWTVLLIILTVLTLGPLIGAITEFGPTEAAMLRYPAYEEWGLATISRFIEHLDFFSIYQWLTGAFIRVGILLFIVVDLLGIREQKRQIWTWVIPPFFLASLAISLLPDELFLKMNEHYLLITTFFFFFLLSIVLAFVAWRSRRLRKRTEVTTYDY